MIENISDKKKSRMPELDAMKFIGIILVVAGHVTRMYTPQGLITTIEHNRMLEFITNVIYSFHMPMFVFVSGMTLAFVSARKSSYHAFWPFVRNKAKRLMIPYFVFALFWVLPFMVGYGFRDFKTYLLNGIILSFDCRHLWYVWMLFNVFILFYILRTIVERFKIPRYCIMIASLSLYVCEAIFGGKLPYFQIDSMLEYQFWFILGYMTMIYRQETRMLMPISIIIGLVSSYFYAPISLFTFALIGVWLTYLLAQRIRCITENKAVNKIVKNSFGIYLFHPIIIYALYYHFGKYQPNEYIFALGVLITSFTISYFLTEMTRMVKLQILIGEK